MGGGHGDCDCFSGHEGLRQVPAIEVGDEEAEEIVVRAGWIREGPNVGRCVCVCSWQSRFPGTQT